MSLPIDEVLCCDCMDEARGLPSLPWGSIAATITDPPYPNNAGSFAGDIRLARQALYISPSPIVLAFWDATDRLDLKLPLIAMHVWVKTDGWQAGTTEAIFEYRRERQRRRNEAKMLPATFATDGLPVHPTQKPLALMRWLIEKVTAPGDIVLDPFAGSGSTLVACVQTGRHFLGMERDPGYCEIARKRIAEAQAQPRLEFDEPTPLPTTEAMAL